MPIRIVSASDDNYSQHLGIMMVSILENTIACKNIEYYIIDGGISKENKEKLESIAAKYGCKVVFLSIARENYEEMYTRLYFGYVTYFRLFITDLMEASVEKILFLDCDMIIKADIQALWEIDISEYFLGAIEDGGVESNTKFGFGIKKSIGMPIDEKYFNAGVLLINLNKWREHNIGHKVIRFISERKGSLFLADQDALNAVLYGKWLQLPIAWNQHPTYYDVVKKKGICREDIIETVKRPLIIHYSQKSKPWNYMDDHPLKYEYEKYLEMSPWKDYIPKDRSSLNIVLKRIINTMVGGLFFRCIKGVKCNYSKLQGFIWMQKHRIMNN